METLFIVSFSRFSKKPRPDTIHKKLTELLNGPLFKGSRILNIWEFNKGCVALIKFEPPTLNLTNVFIRDASDVLENPIQIATQVWPIQGSSQTPIKVESDDGDLLR